MNENQEKLFQFLLETLQDTKVFAVEQAPEVIRQMLEFGAYDAKIGIYMGAACFVAGIVLIAFASLADEISIFGIFGGIVGMLLLIGGPISIASNFTTLKKIEMAPKVYLIERLRK